MPSRLNQLTINELKQKFQNVDTCLFVDFTGLSGRKAAELRRHIHTACGGEARFTVIKTSLARQALAQLGSAGAVEGFLAGPTGIAYGADDPAVLARTLADWGKKEKLLPFKGGLLAGRPMPADAVAELAKIPPKPILMAHVIRTIAAPLSSLLAVAQGPIRKLLGLADALARKNAESGTAGQEPPGETTG